MADPNIDRILNNRYKLVETIGQGAMGRVYRAEDLLLGGMQVAVKLLSQSLMNQRMRDRFNREATICALLRSIHIVDVRDYGVDDRDDVPYYVMEYLQGESLSDIILRQPLRLPRFLSITRQICLGLQCAHEGIRIEGKRYPIVHRDIKPSNILILKDPSVGELTKILDFGIAKTLQADAGQTSSFMGTLAYSSPEQMEGLELDARSDIYSLGVMMYQMLTGKMPIHADTHTFGSWYVAHRQQVPRPLDVVNPNLRAPKPLERLILGCLEKAPGNRPQTVSAIIRELKNLEGRYEAGEQLGERIEQLFKESPPVVPKSSVGQRSLEDILRLSSWPASKPVAEISFPLIMPVNSEPVPTLWVMLNEQEIQNRHICTRYNQFLFVQSPHPTLLWLTVLYNRKLGARWLSTYLDLKSPDEQKLVRLLSETGKYYLLFFSMQNSVRCANVMVSKIDVAQCKLLRDWMMMGPLIPQRGQFAFTKGLLKNELDKLKPKILMKLESMYTDSGDFSG